jgi:type I restriction enzyme S subunit
MAANNIPVGAIKTFDWSAVPSDWRFELLGNLATVRRGASPRPAGDPRYFAGTIPWFKIGDATRSVGRYLSSTEVFVNEEGARRSVRVAPGTLLISNSGVSLGFAVIAGVEGCIHDGWLLVENLHHLDRDYLYYVVNLLTRRIRHIADGTTQPNLNTDIARRLLIPLPPLSEQRSIANILGTFDDKIELNRQMNETLEAIARATFKSWFVDFEPVRAKADGRQPYGMDATTAAVFSDSFEESPFGKIPKGWTAVPLPAAFELNPPRSLQKGAIGPYLDMANMPTTSPRAREVIGRPFGSGVKFSNGDTLIARITPCLENGKTAFVDFLQNGEVGWGSTEYIVLRSKPPLPLEYAYFLARSPDFRAHAILNMTGTSGRQRVPISCFDGFLVVVPSAIVAEEFGKIVKPTMVAIKQHDEESRTLAAIRDALLPKLLSGEVRIRDAERMIEKGESADALASK